MKNQSIKDETDLLRKLKQMERELEIMALSVEFEAIKTRVEGMKSVDRLLAAGFDQEFCKARSDAYASFAEDIERIANKYREIAANLYK